MEEKTMKKTYIQPNMGIYTIKNFQVLMSSTVSVSSESYSEGNMTDLAHENNFWEEEE